MFFISGFKRQHLWLAVIVLAYFVVAGLFAIRTPAWQTPDEPAHYNAIRQIAAGEGLHGCCPVIAAGDWDQPYLEQIKSARFAPDTLAKLDSVQYEDHQPPLYYLLASLVYRLTDGSLTALRLFSVAVGAIIVLCAYGVGVTLYPNRPEIGLGAAAFVAFQPMHVTILASVNNDALGWAVIALILLASVRYVVNLNPSPQPPPRVQGGGRSSPHPPTPSPSWRGGDNAGAVMLGVLVGVGFLTKATTYPIAAVAGLAVVITALKPNVTPPPSPGMPVHGEGEEAALTPRPPLPHGEGEQANGGLAPLQVWRGVGVRLALLQNWRVLAVRLVLFLIPALLLGLLWWLRNFDVYGFPDFLGLAAHDRVVVGQPRTAELIERVGMSEYLSIMLRDSYNSFWGQFGWMALPLYGDTAGWVYSAIAGFLAFCGVGLVIGAVVPRLRISPPEGSLKWERRAAWALLILTTVLALLAYVYYNTEFLQPQGRYTFPLLIPLGLALALGVDAWRRLMLGRFAPSRWLTPLVFFAFAALDVWLLWRVIVPNLMPIS